MIWDFLAKAIGGGKKPASPSNVVARSRKHVKKR